MWYAKVVCELLILAQGNRWNCIGKGTHDSVISSEWGPDICAYQHRIGLYLMSYYCCSILSPYCPMFRMFRICRSHSDTYRDTRNILTIYTQYDGGKVVPKWGGEMYSFLVPVVNNLVLPQICSTKQMSGEHTTNRCSSAAVGEKEGRTQPRTNERSSPRARTAATPGGHERRDQRDARHRAKILSIYLFYLTRLACVLVLSSARPCFAFSVL